MHLLMIGPDWETTYRFRSDLVRDMVASGWTVTIVAGSGEGDRDDRLRALGATCIDIGWRRTSIAPLRDLYCALEIARLSRRLKPDAVLAFTVKPATFGVIGARLGGVTNIAAMITGVGYALMDGEETKRRIIRTAVTTLYRLAIQGVRTLIFQNDDDRDDFRRLGLSRAGVRTVRVNGSGVDLSRFAYKPVPEGPLRFVMVARLLREKGVHEFVDAARKVRQVRGDVIFDLVGPLDHNPTALSADEVRGLEAEGVVVYHGGQSDVRPFLEGAHVFVLPSYREGTPRSALEALAVGRPVLACDVPGSREVVIPGQTGLLVDVRSADAVADGMRWFLALDRDALVRMSDAARQDAIRRFDVHKVNTQIMDAIQAC